MNYYMKHIPGWAKLAAVLILLVSLLLGGILAPAPAPVQALNMQLQVTSPLSSSSTIGVNGTLASFTALIPLSYLNYMPLISR